MEIPGYTIDKQIGKGGMAKVYLARHLGLERLVAIKVMNRELDDEDSDYSDRFMREARIVANLTHQNIVTVYDVGMHDGHHYIAMEYLPGGITLEKKLKEDMDMQTRLATLKQMAAALGLAHSKDIVHRDVKPENIMYREDGSAVLTDFGIARATNSATKMTATGTVIGTPHYMSPEQAQGQEIGSFSDIYSLGVVFYEMLTGEVPYDAESTIAVVFKHITDPIPILEGELTIYQPILDRMLAKTREERYESCEQLIEDINSVIGGDEAGHATIINKATVINKATAINNATAINRATAINKSSPRATDEQPSIEKGKSNKVFIAAISTGVVVAIALIVGGYFYSQQITEEERFAEQNRKEEIKQVQLKEQEAKLLAEKQRKQAKLKAKQKEEKTRIAALQQKKSKEEQLAAQKKAEQKAIAMAKQAAADKAAKQARQVKQKKINALLATAEQQLLNTKLNEAYKTYKSALKLEPRNKRAKNGITRVASQYLSLANVAAAGYKFDLANQYINTVIKIAPSHNKLSETQEKVFTYKNEQLVKKAENARKLEQQATTQQTKSRETEKKPRRSFGGF